MTEHSEQPSPGADRATGASSRPRSEFQQAVDRFEQAVQDLVGSATTEFSERATSLLNETTARLEREFGRRDRDPESGEDAAARMAARRARRRSSNRSWDRYRSERLLSRSTRLCRDVENAKIVGVCAGIANYYGVEAWVVRCIAVTGLLFFGSIVFPAYWIMYFVMEDPRRAARRKNRVGAGATDPLPELRREQSPRQNLKGVQADLREVELRLRRMETHVTSGRYELQRELHRIESDDSTPGRTDG